VSSIATPDVLLSIGIVLLILVGIPVLLLKAVDLGRSLRSNLRPSMAESAAGLLLAILQMGLALLAAVIGLAIAGWVIYALSTRAQPVFPGGLLSLLVGVSMMLVGIRWLRQVFSRSRPADPSQSEEIHPPESPGA
jgi:hypothetical protein